MDNYKGESDKCFKILNCLRPMFILLNGPPGVGKSVFAQRLKRAGFTLHEFDQYKAGEEKALERVHALLRQTPIAPVVIVACIEEKELIDKMFDEELFSYVFLYPNDKAAYREHLFEKTRKNPQSAALMKTWESDGALLETTRKANKEPWEKQSKEIQSAFTKLTKNLVERAKKVYDTHMELFKGRIFTVLI